MRGTHPPPRLFSNLTVSAKLRPNIPPPTGYGTKKGDIFKRVTDHNSKEQYREPASIKDQRRYSH